MFLIALYLFSTLLAPAPLVSMTVVTTSDGQHIQTVIHLLNSDDRYADFAVVVTPPTDSSVSALPPECTPALVCTLHAQLRALQTITVTLALDATPVCGAHPYSMIVTAGVLTDTVAFARAEIGGVASFACPYRLYVP